MFTCTVILYLRLLYFKNLLLDPGYMSEIDKKNSRVLRLKKVAINLNNIYKNILSVNVFYHKNYCFQCILY